MKAAYSLVLMNGTPVDELPVSGKLPAMGDELAFVNGDETGPRFRMYRVLGLRHVVTRSELNYSDVAYVAIVEPA